MMCLNFGLIITNRLHHHSAMENFGLFDRSEYNSYVRPRFTCNTLDGNDWFPDGIRFNSRHVSMVLADDDETECAECQYSENCNGQMCFFSMI